MGNILLASLIYFFVIFLLGFILGTIRTLFLVPNFGDLVAVSLEVPFMLLFSWKTSLLVRNRFHFRSNYLKNLTFGVAAFGILFLTETLFAVKIFGLSYENYFQNLQSPAGLLGLSAQIIFGLIPVCQFYFETHH